MDKKFGEFVTEARQGPFVYMAKSDVGSAPHRVLQHKETGKWHVGLSKPDGYRAMHKQGHDTKEQAVTHAKSLVGTKITSSSIHADKGSAFHNEHHEPSKKD